MGTNLIHYSLVKLMLTGDKFSISCSSGSRIFAQQCPTFELPLSYKYQLIFMDGLSKSFIKDFCTEFWVTFGFMFAWALVWGMYIRRWSADGVFIIGLSQMVFLVKNTKLQCFLSYISACFLLHTFVSGAASYSTHAIRLQLCLNFMVLIQGLLFFFFF